MFDSVGNLKETRQLGEKPQTESRFSKKTMQKKH